MVDDSKLVSILIVNWNGIKHLKKCFNSLSKITYPNYEIILIDNASQDGSVEFVRKNYPQVRVIQNKKNLGFAEANNIGYKEACGKYIFFLNNDTTIEPDCLTKLIEGIERDKNIGGIQPKILVMDEPKKLDCVGDFLTATGILQHYGIGGNANAEQYNKVVEIFSMKGAAMLFKRGVLEEVGVFDKDFFAYFEETDLCHRVRLAGYKIFYYPDSLICHKGSGTTRTLSFNFIQIHAFKNRICSYLKNFGKLELLKVLPLHLLVCELVAIFYSFKRMDLKFFFGIQQAIWWNIRHLGKTLEKRKKVQKQIRKIQDKEFIPQFKKKIKFSDYWKQLLTSFTFKLRPPKIEN